MVGCKRCAPGPLATRQRNRSIAVAGAWGLKVLPFATLLFSLDAAFACEIVVDPVVGTGLAAAAAAAAARVECGTLGRRAPGPPFYSDVSKPGVFPFTLWATVAHRVASY